MEFPEFNELFMDLLPYFQDLDTDNVIRNMIDDFNGALDLAIDASGNKDIDYNKLANTLKYVVTDSTGVVSERGMHALRDAVTKLVYAFFDILARCPRWANMRYKYVGYKIRPGGGTLTLVLDGTVLYAYPDHICTGLVDTARVILENFRDYDSNECDKHR